MSLATAAPTLETLWFTRCPVPTATGIAADRGLLTVEFAADNITVRSLQDQDLDVPRDEHFTHRLTGLIREGGNVPALWARANGAPTRLLGLTWIEERQVVVTRPGVELTKARDLVGLRVAIPRRDPIAIDFWRAMALAGFTGALRSTGHTLAAVVPVEVVAEASAPQWVAELEALRAGDVDAVYLKGAVAVATAQAYGAEVALDLDALGSRSARVNNGTPRPITVHQNLLEEHPDVVIRFLAVLLEAAEWARTHPAAVADVLAEETGAGRDEAVVAYGIPDLSIDLSQERLDLLARQEEFLAAEGFLPERVDVQAWAAPEFLAAAHDLVARRNL